MTSSTTASTTTTTPRVATVVVVTVVPVTVVVVFLAVFTTGRIFVVLIIGWFVWERIRIVTTTDVEIIPR
jgi:hypothetical protein